jgi:GH24 family phage-related lysozyme (muramidase)
MATVPTILPDTRPDPRLPDDYLHVQANPNQFGERLGQGVERLGQGVSAATLHFSQIQGDQVKNDTLKQGADLVSKLTSLKGNDALTQGPEIQQQLDDLYKEGRSKLSLNTQILDYDDSVRPYFDRTWAGIIRDHLDKAATQYGTEVNNSAIDVRANNAALYYKDPKQIEAQATQAKVYVDKQLALTGQADLKTGKPYDPNVQSEAYQQALAKVYGAAADAMVLDPTFGATKAQQFLTQHKDEIGRAYPILMEKLQERADIEAGQAGSTKALQKAVGEHGVDQGLTDAKWQNYSKILAAGDVAGALSSPGVEGFIPAPQWDYDHLRLGYGSDTYTRQRKPDGTWDWGTVTATTRVTEPEAKLDLQRRTEDYKQKIQKTLGADAWTSLSSGAQNALVSIAYNYGSVPTKVMAAAREGDPQKLAEAFAARANDGPFKPDGTPINYQRRLAEAKAVFGGVQAPAEPTENIPVTPASISAEPSPSEPATAPHIPAPPDPDVVYAAQIKNIQEDDSMSPKQKQMAMVDANRNYRAATIAALARTSDQKKQEDQLAQSFWQKIISHDITTPDLVNQMMSSNLPIGTREALYSLAKQELGRENNPVSMGPGHSDLYNRLVTANNPPSMAEILEHGKEGGDVTLSGIENLVKTKELLDRDKDQRLVSSGVQRQIGVTSTNLQHKLFKPNEITAEQKAQNIPMMNGWLNKVEPALFRTFEDWAQKNPKEDAAKFPLFDPKQLDTWLESVWPKQERDVENLTGMEIPENVNVDKWISTINQVPDDGANAGAKAAWARATTALVENPTSEAVADYNAHAKGFIKGEDLLAQLGVKEISPQGPGQTGSEAIKPEAPPTADLGLKVGEYPIDQFIKRLFGGVASDIGKIKQGAYWPGRDLTDEEKKSVETVKRLFEENSRPEQ